ncbi:WD repeat-containing protein 81-like [Lytechinus pictus]|uniref:WD repeat-containing protein 81-like n=1 Tax=Lytechinus pictus TaxID=7653 RepID=UPI0030B9C5A9
MGEEEGVIKLSQDLNLDPFQIQQNLDPNTFAVVVHEKWVRHIQKTGSIPSSSDASIPKWSSTSRSIIFSKAVKPWQKITVCRITKPTNGALSLPPIKIDMKMGDENSFMEFMERVAKQIYQTEWEEAYHNTSSTLNRYHHSLSDQVDSTTVIDLIQQLYGCPIISINDMSDSASKTAGKSSNTAQSQAIEHSNMVSLFCCIVTKDCLYLLQPHHEHTVQDVTMFSPASLSGSHGKVLFVIFQMLHAVSHCHQRGMSCGNVSLSDFTIDEKLWVQFCGPKWNDVLSFVGSNQRTQRTLPEGQRGAIVNETKVQSDKTDINQPCAIGGGFKCVPKMDALPEIMQKWAMGQLTNYEYLMILNRLANRQMGNPNHHPIMPWVMDFTQPNGSYRDFSKSKYRLNKGDNQLDFTYESALQMQALNEEHGSNLAGQVPHHISDVLSEITYYIYKARCTPKTLLQTHVRSVWVPNEYPASMQRLQGWTPDECIPEFFSDASIFKSIHDDLPDLEVPTWCNGPEDFVQKHRAVLESPYVSERLHRWIDLTFGCKLSGTAAVRAKNVVLCVVDQHTLPANNGVVQLFNVPHPKRFSPSPYMSMEGPDIERSQIDAGSSINVTIQEESVSRSDQDVSVGSEGSDSKVISDQDTMDTLSPNTKDNLTTSAESERSSDLQESDATAIRARSQSFNTEAQNVAGSYSAAEDLQLSKNPIRKLPFFRPKSDMPLDSRLIRPELATIVLPEEYDPLSALNQLESLYSFTSKSSYDVPVTHKVEETQVHWQQLVARDMVAIGCIVAELCLAPKLRFRQIGSDLESRWRHLQRVVGAEYQELPRPLREIVHTLLRMDTTLGECLPWEQSAYFESGQNGLPPLSPSLLLQHHSGLISFPQYFQSLHQFLSELHLQRFQVDDQELHQTDLTDHQAMNMVHLARQWLPKCTKGITEEGRDILLPYIRSLFEEGSTAVYAALSLFSKYTAHLGPKAATDELLAPLGHLFDSDFTSPDYLLLFQHSFLSQVIMSLGLKPFLNTLVNYVTEATNGLKQCPMFMHGANEQTSCIATMASGASNTAEEAETFLDGTEGMSVDEELFGIEDGDEVGDEVSEERTIEQGMNDKLQIELEDVDQVKENLEDDDVPVSQNGDDGSSLSEQASPLDSEGSETMSLGKEPDTSSISSGNLPSLSEEPGEGSPTIERIPSKDVSSRKSTSSPSPSTHSQTKEQDLLFTSQTKATDQYRRTYKKQLSSKLYQVNTLIGKSLSDVASESIMWLAHRIGPTLTVRFITPKLLESLSGCYMTPEQLIYCYMHDDVDSNEINTSSVCIGKKSVAGDINSKPVLKCLTDIAVLYGDQFIFQQYLPYIKETVRRVQRKVSAKLEGRLICSVVLLRHVLPYLTDSSLMQKLQYLFGKFIHPLLDIMSCTSISFPSGSEARAVICFKLVDILNAIALRIGREMTRDHMKDILKRFFLCFKLGASTFKNLDRQSSLALSTDSEDKYLVIDVDDETNQLVYGSPVVPHSRLQSNDSTSDLSTTPHSTGSLPRPSSFGAQIDESTSLEDMRGVLQEVFTPELAHAAYIPLCRLTGSIYMENILENHEQIWALSSKHEKAMSTQLSPTIQSPFSDDGSTANSPVSYLSEERSWSLSVLPDQTAGSLGTGRSGFGGHMTVIGNRIEPAFGGEEPSPALNSNNGLEGKNAQQGEVDTTMNSDTSPRMEMNKSKRTLKGTWLSYWEQYLAREDKDNSMHFCQIKLQTFTGHTNGVKALCMMPNENTFLSASKDKTVKIWSLRNSGDGSSKSSCQLTYPHHRKTVFDVRLLESQRLVASCDGNVHVWDPINGAAVRGYDLSRSAPSCMEVMPAPSPCLVVSSGDSSVRFIDTRHGGIQQEIRVASGPLGLIRCMAVSQDGYTIGVGFSSGVLSMVDLRTGLLMGGWRAHEGEILQIKRYNNHTFLTSSVDHTMTLWKEDSTKVCHFRGAAEPIHCICISDEQILSATFGNRIGIHTAVNSQASYSCSKLRSDSFKGAIGAISVLPLNKLMLVASDNGSIFLLA